MEGDFEAFCGSSNRCNRRVTCHRTTRAQLFDKPRLTKCSNGSQRDHGERPPCSRRPFFRDCKPQFPT
nr:MAG TPA: hypothetical protein [Caudoviricetes sp.]